MVDADSAIQAFALARSGFAALQFARGVLGDDDVIAAAFDAQGTRTAGDARITVERNPHAGRDDVWWFSVELEGYTFERIPVVDSVIEQHGQVPGASNLDARYWRWVSPPQPGALVGGGTDSNVLVEFVVIGYSPKALVEHFSP